MEENYVPNDRITDKTSVASHSCTAGNSIEIIRKWFTPPFWYDAESGGYIFDNNGNMIMEVRGWGRFSSEVGDDDKAWEIQNQIGELLANVLNRIVSIQPIMSDPKPEINFWGGVSESDMQQYYKDLSAWEARQITKDKDSEKNNIIRNSNHMEDDFHEGMWGLEDAD